MILTLLSVARADALIWLDFSLMDFASDFNNTSCSSQTAFERVVHERVAEVFSPFEVWVTRRQPIRGDVIRARFITASPDGFLGHANGGDDYDGDGRIDGGYWNDGGEARLDVFTSSIGAINVDQTSGPDVNGLNCTELGRVVANAVVTHELGHAIALGHGSGNPLSCSVDPGAPWDVLDPMPTLDDLGFPSLTTFAHDMVRFNTECSRPGIAQEVGHARYYDGLNDVGGHTGADLVEVFRHDWNSFFWYRHTNLDGPAGWGFMTVAGTTDTQVWVADVTGDGVGEIIRIWPRSSDGRLHVRVFQRSGAYWTRAPSFDLLTGAFLGDLIRFADITGDGQDDLVYGIPDGSGVDWFVHRAQTAGWSASTAYAADIGDRRDQFFFVDMDDNGRDDLVRKHPVDGDYFAQNFHDRYVASSHIAPGQSYFGPAQIAMGEPSAKARIEWWTTVATYSLPSGGWSYSPKYQGDLGVVGFRTDSHFLMDYMSSGDRRADIVVSHAPDENFGTSSGYDQPRTSEWSLYFNDTGSLIGPYTWGLDNISVAGDLVRHGDLNADGQADLLLMNDTGGWTAVEAASFGFGPRYPLSLGVGYNALSAYRRHLFP